MYQQQTITTESSNIFEAFNVLKVIAMIGMPFVHILENYEIIGELSAEGFQFKDSIYALTVFGPSVFMFCMGLGMSKDTSPERLFKRGVQMLIINLFFTIVRMSIPEMVAVAVSIDSWMDLFCKTFQSDIYSFVGFFYIFRALVIKLKLSAEKLLIVALMMLAVNVLVSSFCTQEVNPLTTLLGHFVSITDNSFFPLLGWAVYPCLGIFAAKKLLTVPHKNYTGIFALGGFLGIILLLIIIPFLQADIIAALSEFAYSSVFRWTHAGLIMAISLITLSIAYFLYQLVKNVSFVHKIASFSPLLLPFYIFQWLAASLVTAYYSAVYYMITEKYLCISAAEYWAISLTVTVISIVLAYKKGFSFTRWLFKVSDYTRWGRKKARA